MLILLAAIFAVHIIGIILLLVATIDNVSPLTWLLYHYTRLVNGDTGGGGHIFHLSGWQKDCPSGVIVHSCGCCQTNGARVKYLTFFVVCYIDIARLMTYHSRRWMGIPTSITPPPPLQFFFVNFRPGGWVTTCPLMCGVGGWGQMKCGTSLISPRAHTTQRVRHTDTRKPVSVHTKLGGINVYLSVLLQKEVQTVNKATGF